MVTLSSVYFALNLAIGLVRIRTGNSSTRQDPAILDNTLQRLINAQGIINPFNFLFSDAVVVWRAWVLVTRKFRVVLSILLLGSVGKSSQRSLKHYAEHTQLSPSSDSVLSYINNDIRRILLIILESGLFYVILWLFAIFADVGVLNEDADTSERALFPHLAAFYPLIVFLLVVGQKSQIENMLAQEIQPLSGHQY
ncbi:hypothetical protein K435DRAFT_940188 [Dendrothele bispora CBS 962.96]|uniref:Uncharacterized protein n=1 Tax=Dendrothele bispora (strain CBS 962.96) TaxID=1314807 RepID=A0A4S8MB94_DENBC|nr:hypothetical protein K435DRAFT_940188 [Dendrothele bispora CBS 962.96]